MVIERGDIWWASLEEPKGSGPGYDRPIVIVQSDSFNRSRIGTIIGVTVTSNTSLAEAPGNVFLSKKTSGLPKDSVANISQVITLDKSSLRRRVRRLSKKEVNAIDAGLRLVLSLV